MRHYHLDMEQYQKLARQAAAEGCVLLVNKDKALPIRKGATVSLFGRNQLNYYKSGTGSGGLVNVDYTVGITEGLLACEDIKINQELLKVYRDWVAENPFDHGTGWAQEPWFQKEMPVNEALVKTAAEQSDLALVLIGRTAGEDKDNSATEGSYYLTEEEKELLHQVRKHFTKMVVVLNTGNIIDMNWVDTYHPEAVLYAWQGGQEGGNGVADVLTGKVTPSGKLTDTIAHRVEDYPATSNFGGDEVNYYQEDIYVGYRYFETVAKESVRYPFGFGLSYTSFQVEGKQQGELAFEAMVTNIGETIGKEVVQLYVEAPQGALGKPARCLVDFAKTDSMKPGEQENLVFQVNPKQLASYDDSGCTGHKSCYVLEAGEYRFYIGTDVRSASLTGSYIVKDTQVTEQLEEAMTPIEAFERFKPVVNQEGGLSIGKEPVPTRSYDLQGRIHSRRPAELPFTEDQGYRLTDVKDGICSVEAFLSQLSNEELACFVRGEGMCSPKVTPGTAGAFGGVTEELMNYGIPIACCADGPSGIRMDCGTKAFSLPNGTLLACTFDRELNERLFEQVGTELGKHRIDALLGPGLNIHRHPLNGRNFEYFSEDPYLTGQMAAAQLRGMNCQGTTGVIKHFCGNNQEFHRRKCNSVISERALREIYLKGFEIAVKEGNASYIMTSYNPVNGIWCAGSYDLNTTILRGEWGFEGVVMTDWWADMNEEGKEASRKNTGYMVRSQNDVYMVVENAKANAIQDNTLEMLEQDVISRVELCRSAANLCQALMRTNAMDRLLHPEEYSRAAAQVSDDTLLPEDITYYDIADGSVIPLSGVTTEKGSSYVFGVHIVKMGEYKIILKARSDAGDLAQIPMTVFMGGMPILSYTLSGTGGEWVEQERTLMAFGSNNYVRLYFGQSGMELQEFRLELVKEFAGFPF